MTRHAIPSPSPIRDEDGHPLRSGDHIHFSFGIPPVSVLARLYTKGGELWIECLSPADVKPTTESLAFVMRYYVVWKASPSRVSAYHKDYRPGSR